MSDRLSIPEIFALQRIAVVGFSTNAQKPSHKVPKYLMEQGYTVYPVNPGADGDILGQTVYATVAEIPEPVDVVCVFRPSEAVPEVLEDVLERSDVKVFWMQQGITNASAAAKAEEHGMTVIQDRCMHQEHTAL